MLTDVCKGLRNLLRSKEGRAIFFGSCKYISGYVIHQQLTPVANSSGKGRGGPTALRQAVQP